MAKEKSYDEIVKTLRLLIGNNQGKYRLDDIGKMAIINTVVKRAFPNLLFVGFYRVMEPRMLQIGPFQGTVLACGTIPFDKGVCGACVTTGETIIVPDVSTFPGYIACDDETKSEIAVPVKQRDKITAVFDLDSNELNGFDEIDQSYLELIVESFI